ncbi:phage baseplate protein [Aureimonas sp. SK2]|uniref:phage baseplate protein n=1 Tax=Aureimonas sp. SK2 TaxID=3015992 RepID=UPI00244383C2|nr:phage baseplate protein [Aureimonas sp. SK2]
MLDPVATRLRRQMRHVERLNRRVSLADVPGKVIAGSQDMEARTLRLDIGRSADGRVIKSPKVNWQQPGAGTFMMHAKPKDGEQMRLRSPSGTVGTASLADWSTFDDDNAPPSKDGEAAVIAFGGKASITFRDGSLKLAVGGASIELTEDKIEQAAEAIALAGSALTHNEKNIGSTHTHGGVARGGARTDPPG